MSDSDLLYFGGICECFFIPELRLKPSIEVLEAPVHPGTLGINEKQLNASVQAESYKTAESTRVFKVSDEV